MPEYTEEDFVLAYVYEWDDFEEAYALAVTRDGEAANVLLQDIKNIDKEV